MSFWPTCQERLALRFRLSAMNLPGLVLVAVDRSMLTAGARIVVRAMLFGFAVTTTSSLLLRATLVRLTQVSRSLVILLKPLSRKCLSWERLHTKPTLIV